jgi:hypothetical protein
VANSALAPVSEAVFAVVQDATLLATLTGGWVNDLPQDPTFPFGWIEADEIERRGLGTGELPEIGLRTHFYGRRGGSLAVIAELQQAARLTRAVLQDIQLTVTGYAMCGHTFWRETSRPLVEELNGVPVWEIVSTYALFVERSA